MNTGQCQCTHTCTHVYFTLRYTTTIYTSIVSLLLLHCGVFPQSGPATVWIFRQLPGNYLFYAWCKHINDDKCAKEMRHLSRNRKWSHKRTYKCSWGCVYYRANEWDVYSTEARTHTLTRTQRECNLMQPVGLRSLYFHTSSVASPWRSARSFSWLILLLAAAGCTGRCAAENFCLHCFI